MEKELEMNRSLAGLSPEVTHVMERLLRMPPEPQKAALKPTGARAEAQRRRREKERSEGEHQGSRDQPEPASDGPQHQGKARLWDRA